MRLEQFNKEVFFADGEVVRISHRDIGFLKGKSLASRRKRVRLCAHNNIKDRLHEMFIVHTRDTYIRPHKHKNKTESLHIIEGRADVIIFDEKGNITEVQRMGDYASGLEFYQRISNSSYHTLLVRSKFLVFHETTNGPFKKSETIFAPWAPAGSNSAAIKKFMQSLSHSLDNILLTKRK